MRAGAGPGRRKWQTLLQSTTSTTKGTGEHRTFRSKSVVVILDGWLQRVHSFPSLKRLFSTFHMINDELPVIEPIQGTSPNNLAVLGISFQSNDLFSIGRY